MAGNGNGFANVRGGFREDLGHKVRSAWEANVERALRSYDGIVLVEYEAWHFHFHGGQFKKNHTYRPDYYIIVLNRKTLKVTYWWIEVKGRLKKGGRLSNLDLSSLAKRDADSYVKLSAMQSQYPEISKRIWVAGEREYRWLKKRHAKSVLWEAERSARSSGDKPQTSCVTTIPTKVAKHTPRRRTAA